MQMIGFLAMIFLGMTVLNRVAEGQFIAAVDVSIVNTLTIAREQEVFGLFTVPVLNPDFFFTGIPHLMKWDYAFFGGNAVFFSYFFYSLTAAVSFMIFLAIVGLGFQMFARR